MAGFVCELTPQCNLNCVFCYNVWRGGEVEQPVPLPPKEFAGVLVPALRQADGQWLAFAGGEPLLYEGLSELMQEVAKELPQVKLGLSSNGTLLSDERLDDLVRCGLSYVELSLFAASKVRYHALTGENLLDDAHASMLRVKARGLPLTVACTLLADGLDEFEDIVLTAMALGADSFAMNPFTPTGHGRAQQDVLGLSSQKLEQFLGLAQGLAEKISMPMLVTLPVEACVVAHSKYPALHFNRCVCGDEKWVVDPQGYLRTCEQNQERIGNLAMHSFAELSASQAVKCFRAQMRKPQCLNCKLYDGCGGGCRFRGS